MTGARKASIRLRFSRVFLFVLAIIMVLGIFSAWRLSDYRIYSDDLRDRFFRSTQYIGDLNNYTSDFRAAEGTDILSGNRGVSSTNASALRALDDKIVLAQGHYEHVVHDADEARVYGQFRLQWFSYRTGVDHILALLRAGHREEAVGFYMTHSRSAYDAASDTLGRLTDLNIKDAAVAAQRAESAFQETRMLTIAAMLFAAMMVAGGLTYMRRSIADPLIDLARAMNELARNNMDIDIHGSERSDEIGGMARAVEIFRLNAIDLAVGQRALADHASILTDKLAEEKRLTQLQRNFLTMASHEFRTPLAVIDGHAQRFMSSRAQFTSQELAERAGKIRHAVHRISGVIDHLIDDARLDELGVDGLFHRGAVNLGLMLQEVCRQHRELVPAADIQEDYGPVPIIMMGDQKLLTHLFSNLVSNAIKYSSMAIRLRVHASIVGKSAVVSIEDDGIGILEADRERIFDRYFRGGNTSGTVGTGVGLYLVKAAVDLHHGDITLESKEHRGSKFIIRLPGAVAARQTSASSA